MAVYERTYRPYEGPLTSERSRFLIPPRYAFREVFASKLFSGFYTLCFVPPLVFAAVIYLHHNLTALNLLHIPEANVPPINGLFFLTFQAIQGFFAFLLSVSVGPSIVCPDFANNALALYLCRPFSRSQYIIGKLTLLVILISLITWIPGIGLFLFQWYLDGSAWLADNGHVARAIFLGFWALILLLALLSAATSAWTRKKMLARISLLGMYFVVGGFAAAINQIFHTRWGSVLSLSDLIGSIWTGFYRVSWEQAVPFWSACLALAAYGSLCLLLLARRVKAYEVVR